MLKTKNPIVLLHSCQLVKEIGNFCIILLLCWVMPLAAAGATETTSTPESESASTSESLPAYVIAADIEESVEITEQMLWERGLSIHFPQNISKLPTSDPNLEELRRTCEQIALGGQQICRMVVIRGSASPEGPMPNNHNLAHARATVITQFVHSCMPTYTDSIDQLANEFYADEDYYGLMRMLENSDWQEAERVMTTIQTYGNNPASGSLKDHLRNMDNGNIWVWLNEHFFPELRASRVILIVSNKPKMEVIVEPSTARLVQTNRALSAEQALEGVCQLVQITAPEPMIAFAEDTLKQHKPFYMSLHTNMLYDIAAVPNIGAEFYIGNNFSIAGNWRYSWYKNDNIHHYWRTYGGYVAARYWMGKWANEKPLTGHHLGVYGQMILYDFEWGGIGYLSGTPGKNMWANPTWAVGVEYGFALPLTTRLNIDFAIGLGYMQGEYQTYLPMDGCYVWQASYMRHWVGPTKAEISLVWLIGRENINTKHIAKRAAKTSQTEAEIQKGNEL